ncbi:MAG: hypothetical protein AAGG08_00165, partial [Actinomycetota bacterium]
MDNTDSSTDNIQDGGVATAIPTISDPPPGRRRRSPGEHRGGQRTSAGLRTRWAAAGAAVAVAIGGIGIADATLDSGERAVYVAIEPCRLVDTRPGADNVGTRSTPLGANETIVVDGTGTVGDCVLPTDQVALELNVTGLNAT